jgi:uncharacterized repeat protein (TIGR03803 family)
MPKLQSIIAKLNSSKWISVGCVLLAAFSVVASAQNLHVLANFKGTDGFDPYTGLVQGFNGSFYGTNEYGGPVDISNNCDFGCGVVFQITPAGKLTMLSGFCIQTGCTDGSTPFAALALATDGSFYGTTEEHGASTNCDLGCGTVFKISPRGQLTTLHSFCLQTGCPDGLGPNGKLVLGSDGNYYGTTVAGGTSTSCYNGCGTVFKISTAGDFTTLYSFCQQSGCPDGNSPNAALVQATDGNFYGTTYYGGLNTSSLCDPDYSGCGTIFRISKAGKFSTVYSFCAQTGCADGANSSAELIQGSDGNFYGTTYRGGFYNLNNCGAACGTVFKITAKGKLTNLHSFCQFVCLDGVAPPAGLVQGNDGNFYGVTTYGGANSSGTIFEVTSAGTFSTLYSFCTQPECEDGIFPMADLIQGTDGRFYGTALQGGADFNNKGTIFTLLTGLGPFVSFVNGVGKVGTQVGILGQGFKGTTAVSFNGTPAKFAVQSSTYLVAMVPEGATSGPVTVTSLNGQLSSNKKFQVLP